MIAQSAASAPKAKLGLSFLINPQQGPAGRGGGSLSWAGLANTYFWIDPSKKVAGVILTQILPFVDPAVMKLYAQFESGVYQGGLLGLIVAMRSPRPLSSSGRGGSVCCF